MQIFAIAPATARPLFVLVPVALVIGFVVILVAVSALGSRRATFEVSAEGLRLRGDFYGRLIPVSALRVGDAQRVDLARGSGLRPRWRTFGTGLPGYQAGWYRLANGESALVYLTDRRKAVHVPTTLGHSVLLSPDDPDAFLAALRSLH